VDYKFLIFFINRFEDTEEYGYLIHSIRHMEENQDTDLLEKMKQRELLEQSPYKASWCRQVQALTWRCLLGQIRSLSVSAIRIIQTWVVATLIGLVYYNQKMDERGVINVNGALFLFLTNTTFANAFTVFNSFPNELPIFYREHHNGMYKVNAYFLAKNLAELLIFIILPSIFVVVDYWLIGLRAGVTHFFVCWIIILLVCKVSVSFGYFLSTSLGKMDLCLPTAIPILQAITFFGGYLLNINTVPSWLSWMQYLSWFRYSYELLLVNQWSGYTNLTCSANSTKSTLSAPCFHDGDSVLLFYGFQNFNYFIDFGGLLILIVVFRIGGYVALLWRSKL
jgi:ATP-binding cassette, subfamily G (WHITE), eye pigment precursor transporter